MIAEEGIVTDQEAQVLPANKLAERVLGSVGEAIVVVVDRPSWPDKPFTAGQAWPPKDPPPLFKLIFYTQPSTGHGLGVCAESVITVQFTDAAPAGHLDDRKKPTFFTQDFWFGGAEFDVPDAGIFSTEYRRKLGEYCNTQKPSRDYFPAPDDSAGEFAVRATALLSRVGKTQPKPKFTFNCHDDKGRPCSNPFEKLAWLDWRYIREVSRSWCSDFAVNGEMPICYVIDYKKDRSTVLGVSARVYVAITDFYDMSLISVDYREALTY